MSFVDAFLPEFDREMQGTRSILALVPDELLGWKAHDNLNTVGWVASHLADTLSWAPAILQETSYDVAPVGGEPHTTPSFDSAKEILDTFDQNLDDARSAFEASTDEQMSVPWSLLQGGNELFTMPRMAVAKMFLLNHIVHHRAFLVAYLRMNDIECPGLYS